MNMEEIILTAFLNGIGYTIATYITNKTLIKHIEKLEKKKR
jgi:hypothetical protein